jgi:hypothetical protein
MHFRSFAMLSAATLIAIAACTASAQSSVQPEKAKAVPVTTPYGIVSTIAGDGWAGYYGDGGPAAKAELHNPNGIALDSEGNIYIADTENQVVRKIAASTGLISTYAGTAEGGYAGDKGPAIEALLYYPVAVAVDAAGNLYIADSGNNVIRRVDKTGIITTFAGNGYGSGPERGCGFSGDRGPADKAELCSPQGVAADGEDNVYISDSGNNVVRKVQGGTGVITTVAGGGPMNPGPAGSPATMVFLGEPVGIAVDGLGNLFIAEYAGCLVTKVNIKTGILTVAAGTHPNQSEYGYCEYSEPGKPAIESPLLEPTGVTVDEAGNLYIAEALNNLVDRVDAHTGILTAVAGDVVIGLEGGQPYDYGVPGYSGDGGVATAAEFVEPWGVATDATGNVYIADLYNNAIRIVTATSAPATPAPVLAPAVSGQGFGFYPSQEVMLSDPASDAAIYYALGGALPTTSSARYDGQLEIRKSTTITAFATSAGFANSDAVGGNYVLLPPPVISPHGGSFTKAQNVMLAVPDKQASIFFTIDGTNPATSGTKEEYFGPISISGSVTLKAAAALGGGYGGVAAAAFKIPTAPIPLTGTATKVGATTATLNGTVNPGDLPTKYWFLYGENCQPFNQKTAVKTLPAGVTTEKVSDSLTKLKQETTYCFELYVSNSKGTVVGSFTGFQTQ